MPTHIGAGNIIAPTSGTTITAAWPVISGTPYVPVTGDIAVVAYVSNVSKSVTAFPGYTMPTGRTAVTNSNVSASIWMRQLVAGDEPPTATISAANSVSSMSALRVVGIIRNADGVDVSAQAGPTFDDDIVFPSVTTTGPNRLVMVTVCFDNDISSTMTNLAPNPPWQMIPRDTTAVTAGNTGIADYNQSVDGGVHAWYVDWATAGSVSIAGTPANKVGDLGASGDSEYWVAFTIAFTPSTVAPPDPVAPSAPTSVVGSANDGSIDLTWSVDNDGSPITGHDIDWALASAPTTWLGPVAGTTATSYSKTGLTNGTAYVFRVRATNAIGTGSWSATTSAVTPSEPSPTVTHAVIGGVTMTKSKFTIRLVGYAGSAISLKISTASNLASPVTFSGTKGDVDVWAFTATGLAPNTTYYYGFGSAAIGTFKTAPSGAKSFKVTAASCWTGPGGGNTTAISRMLAKNPDIFLSMGDWPYIDNTTAALAPYYNGWNALLSNAQWNEFLKNRVLSYHNSDHDGAANNYIGTAPTQPFFLSAYRNMFPTYELPGVNNDIYHTFVWGRVRFIMLDVHTNRTSESGGVTILGASQKQWLKDTLLAAEEPVIVLGVVEPWIASPGTDGWGLYTGERLEINQFIHTNGLSSRIIILHGDSHGLHADSGANNTYGTGGAPGAPVFGMAPLDRSVSSKGGPYDIGTWANDQRQYGMLDIVDNGGSTITVNVSGYTVTSSTTETQRFNVPLTFAATPETGIYAGDDKVIAVYHGDDLLDAVYAGDELLWSPT